MNDNKEFKPYIPAEKVTAEMTVTSVIMGVILAIVFGAANAYLGLRVGMTVSASIPAAVISMGVIRVIMSHLQQVLFSQCLLFFYGQKKVCVTNQVWLRSL